MTIMQTCCGWIPLTQSIKIRLAEQARVIQALAEDPVPSPQGFLPTWRRMWQMPQSISQTSSTAALEQQLPHLTKLLFDFTIQEVAHVTECLPLRLRCNCDMMFSPSFLFVCFCTAAVCLLCAPDAICSG